MLKLSWLLPLATLFQEMSALKKEEEKKIYEEIKRGKCPKPRKRKKKSETRGKNGQVSEVELGVQRCPLERKKWTSVRQ